MKKLHWLALLTALILALSSLGAASAEILPPYGEGQIGYMAFILCEELSLREKPSASAKVVKTLQYGDFLLVVKEADGWAYCALGDAEDSPVGYVNTDYIVIDPYRYVTDETTTVYAWNDTNAPKIALLEKDTMLPILKDEDGWLIVSLRGAVGFIKK